jgi:peptidoglycan/xylan/chitin deacetylase (PgdA/CDA1 family)
MLGHVFQAHGMLHQPSGRMPTPPAQTETDVLALPTWFRERRQLTLCFHGIGSPGRQLEPGESRYWLTVERFQEILDAVKSHPQVIGITFDDSNESDHGLATPELLQRDLIAEFFVVAARIGEPGSLSRDQIEEMSAAGMLIGTHGMNHRRWRDLTTPQEIEEELEGSAARLADIVQRPVRHAAFPNGSYDRRVLRLARRAGFERVYTVDGGTSRRSAWLQTRYTVHEEDDADSIRRLLDQPDGTVTQFLVRSGKSCLKRWR